MSDIISDGQHPPYQATLETNDFSYFICFFHFQNALIITTGTFHFCLTTIPVYFSEVTPGYGKFWPRQNICEMPQHSFAGQMTFLAPNRQHQSTKVFQLNVFKS